MPGKTVSTRLALSFVVLLAALAHSPAARAEDVIEKPPAAARPVATPEPPFWSGPRIAASIVVGAGISAIIAGAVVASRSDAALSALKAHCLSSDPDKCDPEGYVLRRRADVDGRAAATSLGVGATAIFLGFALGWINPETPPAGPKPAGARAFVAPTFGPRMGGFTIVGVF